MSTTPTPQSDQAATTPGRAEELAKDLEYEAYLISDEGRSVAAAMVTEAAALLRAQSAELLALRALLRGAEFELRCYLPVLANAEDNPETWERITRGTGIATTNGIRHTLGKIDAALNSPTQGAK